MAALSLEDIRSPQRPTQFTDLLNALHQQPGPAYIADGLWFIHALNGAMLNLFGIASNSPFLSMWPAWHLVAGSLAEDSPVHAAFAQRDVMFPPTVALFFQVAAPYLFTRQMHALVARIHALPHARERKFSEWWYLATSLSLHFNLSDLTRGIMRHGEYLMVAPHVAAIREVALNNDYAVPYGLGYWEPVGAAAARERLHLRG